MVDRELTEKELLGLLLVGIVVLMATTAVFIVVSG